MPAETINRWKELVIAGAGLVLVILQIVNVFLSADIDNSLGSKASQLQEKQNALEKLLEKQTAQLQSNREVSLGNSKVVTDTNTVVHELDRQVTTFGAQLNEHVQNGKQLMKMLEASKPSPTPQ